jgi:hypothetical protein
MYVLFCTALAAAMMAAVCVPSCGVKFCVGSRRVPARQSRYMNHYYLVCLVSF